MIKKGFFFFFLNRSHYFSFCFIFEKNFDPSCEDKDAHGLKYTRRDQDVKKISVVVWEANMTHRD